MKTLLLMSLTGSALALIVMTVRAVFGKRLHPRVTYALWLAVALCLLVPLRFESRVSVMNVPQVRYFEQNVSARMEQPVAYGFAFGSQGEATADPAAPSVPAADAPTRTQLESGAVSVVAQPEPQGFSLDAWDVLGLIWMVGAGIVGGSIWVVNVRFRRRVRRSRRAATVPWVMQRRLRKTRVYVSRAVPSPCLVGVIRPFIVVTPQAMEEDERLCHVLMHELMHRRQGDPLWSLVRTAALILHWYNPIVWIAASLSRADCENACDALTIRELGEESRVDYGKTLLAFLRAKPTATGLVNTATTMAQSRKQIRRRIGLIAKKRRYTGMIVVLCVALVLTGCAMTMTNANPDAQTQPPSEAVNEVQQEADAMSEAQRLAFDGAKREALAQGERYRYAETDVDGDGKVELILICDAETMAGQSARVLAYDEDSGALREQLSEFSLLTFYGNGVVTAGWSHNQGLAGDALWPYNLYQYDPAADAYVLTASVDAWDERVKQEGFPREADPNGAGVVYYIMADGVYDTSQPVSQAEYDEWRTGLVGSAANLQIDLRDLTADDLVQAEGDTRPGGQLRVYMDTYEVAIESYAAGFENMSEEAVRAALPELEDFTLYGRKNDAGDAYVIAVLREAPTTQAVVRRFLRLAEVATGEEDVTMFVEEYGITDAGEEVVLRSYSISGNLRMTSIPTGSAQDTALAVVLEGSAEQMLSLLNPSESERELFARSIGLMSLEPQSYPYLSIPMQNEQTVAATGYAVSLDYYASVEDSAWAQLQELLNSEEPVDSDSVDWKKFWEETEYVAYLEVHTGPDDLYRLSSEGLLHYRNGGMDLVGRVDDAQAVEWVRRLISERIGYDPLEYVGNWMHRDKKITRATLSFPNDTTGEMRTQTLEDAQSLEMLAQLIFEPQEILQGGSGCPFGGVLTIQTESDTLTLFVASDSCDVLCSQGVIYFEYMGGQEELFRLFPECNPYRDNGEYPAQVEILETGASGWRILDDAAAAEELYDLVKARMTVENEQHGDNLGKKRYELDFRSAETKRLLLVELYENGFVVDDSEYRDTDGVLLARTEESAAS